MATNWVLAQAVVPTATTTAAQTATITAPVAGSLLTATPFLDATTTAPTSFTVSDNGLGGGWTALGAIQVTGLFATQTFYKISDGTETSVTTTAVGYNGIAQHRMEVDNFTVTGGGTISVDLTVVGKVTASSFSVSPSTGSSAPSFTDELAFIAYGVLGTSQSPSSGSFTGTSALANAALCSTTTDTAFACRYVGGVQASATASTNVFKAAVLASVSIGYACATFSYSAGASGTGASTATLTGVATGAVGILATGASTATLSGAATGTVGVVATGAGSATLAGIAVGAISVPGVGASTATITGVAAGVVELNGTGSSTATLTGSAVGVVRIGALAASTATLTGIAVGTWTTTTAGAGAGSATLTGTATGAVGIPATAAGTATLTGIAVGVVQRPVETMQGLATITLSCAGAPIVLELSSATLVQEPATATIVNT